MMLNARQAGPDDVKFNTKSTCIKGLFMNYHLYNMKQVKLSHCLFLTMQAVDIHHTGYVIPFDTLLFYKTYFKLATLNGLVYHFCQGTDNHLHET